ncbi:cytoskeleton-associated protein 4 [Pseudophryne corroboree]|uniref:cytoskeleton-associated protein 4 n=1 Tax=Pseudophryne corroboree TaxID=495146 RepID=UPI0030820CCF
MTSSRHRNKSASPENSSQAAAASANDLAKKSPKPNKVAAAAPGPGPGVLHRLCTLVFYLVLIAGAAATGWFVYNLLEEVSSINSKLQHLSEQKGELAQTVNTLQKQVDLLQKTVGRVEFISKDIQEKQQSHDTSIKNSEKELDVVSVILKKLQKDVSNVIQNVKDQGDRDLVLFDRTMREKFTELNNSINDEIAELTEVQKLNQDDVNNVKAKIASLGELNSINDELNALKELAAQLQTSYKSKEESIDWLINNAINVDSVTANSNQIVALRNEHENLKRDVQEQSAAVEDLKEKVLKNDESSVKGELERILNDFEQISSSVSEMENNYVSANNDLLKEIETNRDGVEQRLGPLESTVEALNAEQSAVESLKTNFEEYSRRLNAIEEAFVGLKHLSSSDAQGSPEVSKTLLSLNNAQQTLSQDIEKLKSNIAVLPNAAADFEKLQLDVTSVIESHKEQIEELKYDWDQWKSNVAGSSGQDIGVDSLNSSVKKLESDLKMLREAVDSLVAYSVKIETHDKDLESVKESFEDLKESTDKLLVKFEQIQESV